MIALEKALEAHSKKVNKIEKVKELKTPKEAFALLDGYAKDGYDSIADEDKSYFLKCFGIYDRPATPGKFMIRVRIPGGQLTYEQALCIGELAKEYGQDYIDITTRQQVELRYLEIENIPTIMKRLSDVGISIYQTGVDNFRNILNDPLDALSFDNVLKSQQLLEKLQSKFLHNYEWISTLPRKFNTAISGSLSNRSNGFGQDCCFVLAQKNGEYGYNLFLGGKVGKIAKNADIFLRNTKEVEECFQAIIELFRDFGFRDNRNKNRLHFLIEAVGMKAFASAIREKAGFQFLTAGDTLTTMDFSDPDQGKVQLKDGTYALHVVIPSGVFTGSAMMQSAELSKKYGSSKIRLDIEQSMYILGVKKENLDAMLNEPFFNTYKSLHSPYFNHLIACAGTEHCPFGVIPNKPDAIEMAEYLTKAVPLESGRVRMYWSACVKGCGIHGLGDIGFEGCKAKVDGVSEYGVHISIGGKLTAESCEGHTFLKSVPLRFAHHYVESLMLEYKHNKNDAESFEQFNDRVLAKYSKAYVGFICRLHAYMRINGIDLDIGFVESENYGTNEELEVFELGSKIYTSLTGNKAYKSYSRVAKILNDIPDMPHRVDSSIDENLSKMVYKMIHPTSILRAEVFSELESFIAIY